MGIEQRDDDAVIRSTTGHGSPFATIVERRLSRRAFLKSGVVASTIVAGTSALTRGQPSAIHAQAARSTINFEAISPQKDTEADVALPENYRSTVLLSWGDPITADAPEFDPEKQTAAAQEQQFGYNCDFVAFLPLPAGSDTSDHGLLVVNHEYTNPEIMFPGYDAENPAPTKEQVDIQLAAHGVSVVEIERDASGTWSYTRDGKQNRRYTATSPMTISGPALGHEWLKTKADSSGKDLRGTLNNCAGGKTPWGTIVTAEENFHQYFANLAALPDDDPRKEVHARYGIPEEASELRWEQFYDRFDIAKEPNEPFRFGWAVEIDPYDPAMKPVKRTSIGRYRHEAQTFVVAPSGQVVAYSGDDARFEYVYKFVSSGTYNETDRTANMSLLDEGTLYVARFNEDGTGDWLPLVFGEGPLTEENGFTSQADLLLKTRLAGDALGATKMDRPEDIETNPVNKKVYMVMTKNDQRGKEGKAPTDAANPRADNKHGHIIEVTEEEDDHTATKFEWEIFLLCGDPKDESTFFADFSKDKVSPISSPDNITFDLAGNLWIATDGQPEALEYKDGLFAVPVDGPERGYLRQFFAAVPGAEVCGPEFTPDNTTLFLALQHPGEGGTYGEPVTSWPGESGPPRPSVIAIQSSEGGPVGSAGAAAPAATSAAGEEAVPAPTTASGQPAGGAPSSSSAAPTEATATGGPSFMPWIAGAGVAAAAAAAAVFLRRRGASKDTDTGAKG